MTIGLPLCDIYTAFPVLAQLYVVKMEKIVGCKVSPRFVADTADEAYHINPLTPYFKGSIYKSIDPLL